MLEIINLYLLSVISLIYLLFNLKELNNIRKIELSENENSRVYFFDFIKGISIFIVFLSHICYFYIKSNNEILSFFSIYFINAIRFVVPFFVISSGYLLEIKDYKKKTIIDFYKKRLFKILIPYFIFCVFLFFLKDYKNINIFLIDTITGKISVPFYFITVLIQLYILYPLIKKIINKLGSKKSLFISFFISLIFGVILPKFFLLEFSYYTFLAYIFFFVFGIVFKKYYSNPDIISFLKKIKFVRFAVIITFIYCIIALIGKEQYFNFQLIYAVILFLLIYYFKEKIEKNKLYKYFCFLGKNSFYIFLIHFTILEFIFKYLNLLALNVYLEYILFIIISLIFIILLPSILINNLKKYEQKRITKN